MFVRQKSNQSGSISVQVIDKSNGYRVVKTIGTALDPVEVARLVELGKLFIVRRSGQYTLTSSVERVSRFGTQDSRRAAEAGSIASPPARSASIRGAARRFR